LLFYWRSTAHWFCFIYLIFNFWFIIIFAKIYIFTLFLIIFIIFFIFIFIIFNVIALWITSDLLLIISLFILILLFFLNIFQRMVNYIINIHFHDWFQYKFIAIWLYIFTLHTWMNGFIFYNCWRFTHFYYFNRLMRLTRFGVTMFYLSIRRIIR